MDEAVAIRVVEAAGHFHGTCFGKKGWPYIQKKIQNYNQTARHINYLTLVDFMDTRLACPAEIVATWLPHRKSRTLFRVVVRELESWLLADRSNIAKFLSISIDKIPVEPEHIPDPKLELINLARKSRNPRVRSALVPDTGSTAQVGKLYTSEMIRFIKGQWDIDVARTRAPSLDRCIRRLEAIV